LIITREEHLDSLPENTPDKLIFGSCGNTSVFAGELRNRFAVPNFTEYVLSNVGLVEQAPPAAHFHILEVDASAGIGLIAADNARGQHRAISVHIAQGYVFHINQGLGLTGYKRVEEAAWVAIATRLVLLLWTDIDRPPDRTVDGQVLI